MTNSEATASPSGARDGGGPPADPDAEDTVKVAGAPGNTLCVSVPGASPARVVLPASGETSVPVTLPAATTTVSVSTVDAGGETDRIVAVGGGTQGGLWTQIVSDVTGREQQIPQQTIGASYGDALLAAIGTGLVPPDTDWARAGRTART